MNKYFVIFRNIVCLACLIFLIEGCEKPTEPPPEPQVVRKKISVQDEAPQPLKKVELATPVAEPAKASPVTVPAQSVLPLPEPKAVADVSAAPEIPKAQPAAPAPEPAKVDRAVSEARKPEAEQKSDITIPPPSAAATIDTNKVPEKPLEIAAIKTDQLKEKEEEKGKETEKIDPFAPLFKEEKTAKPKAMEEKETKKRIPLTPLEKIDLSQLKLVGIVRSSSEERAMVEEASGKGYIVTTGTYIGINSGRVVQILKDGIVIEEEFEDALGKVSISKTELKLQKPPGEF